VTIPVLQDCAIGSCPQVYSASYPGSGAELFRAVIEAISGLTSSEVYSKNKNLNQHFLIKTHGPLLEHWANKLEVEPKQAVYLIRNPLWSLPSYFNFEYEQKNKLPDHSAQAPEEKWLEWRDKNFSTKFKQWQEHVDYWASHKEPDDMFIISYEDLTAYETGPLWTHRVGRFLESKTGVSMAQANRVGCLWNTVVKGGKSKKRGTKTYTPNFSAEQLDEMERVLQELQQEHGRKFQTLQETLEGYIKSVQERRQNNVKPETNHNGTVRSAPPRSSR